jgi:hypothetical protein
MSIEEDKKEFLRLIAGDHKEQVFQDFLESHTRFIPREFVQNHGIGQHLVLRNCHLALITKQIFSTFPKVPMIGMLSSLN